MRLENAAKDICVCLTYQNLILLAAVFNCRTPMAIYPSAEPPHKPQAFVHL